MPSSPVSPVSYAEAVAETTGRGQIFEVVPATIRGVEQRIFANAPTSLRALFDAARGYGDKTFLVYGDERLSFAQVMGRVDGFARLLVDTYGVRPGDRVAIAMRNLPEWVMAFAAITSVGAVSVSLNAWWTEQELAFALADSAPRVLVADPPRLERALATCRRLDITAVVVRAGDADLPPDVARWEEVLPAGASLPEVAVGSDDDATILYTSGTTGEPKGAVSTHRAVLQALMGFACKPSIDALREGPPSGAAPADEMAFILVVPLFHVTGCVPVMLSCFALGLKLVIMYRWEPEEALRLIERERITTFVGVPTQSWDLLECDRFGDFDTSSLRSVGGGGAPAPPALVRRIAGALTSGGPGIGYGLTETNAYGPGNSGPDYLTHPASTGRATPILDVTVRDADGKDLPAGQQGEIWLKGPNIIRGYWNRPEDTAAAIVDGWLRTGDIGHLDEDGFLYVDDRLKDVILRGGENVYSAEVEAAIYEHPAVHEAAVFGVPHPRLGEEVAAVVVTKPGADLDQAGLASYLASRLAAFKVPTRVAVVAEPLPRNAAGKIMKREIRAGFDA